MEVLQRAPGVALGLVQGALLPGATWTPALWVLFLASLGVAVVGFALAGGEARAAPVPRRLRRSLGLGTVWFLAFVGIYSVVGWVGAWYFLLPSIGVAVAFAALLGGLVRATLTADVRPRCRPFCAAAAVGLGTVALWQAGSAPLLRGSGEWERASQVAEEFLTELDARIAGSVPGQAIDAPPLPMWAQPRPGAPGVEGAAILSDYSVQAWADLVHPARRVRVLGIEGGLLPLGPEGAAPDELVVRLVRRRAGY